MADDWARTVVDFESPYKLPEIVPADSDKKPALIKKEQRFKIRIASSDTRRHMASMLIQKMYLRRGYHSPALNQHPYRITVLVSQDERIVGTTTLGLDSEDGLLADETYKAEIEQLRREGRHPCELTKLAIDDENVDSKHIVAVLFHLCKIYGGEIHHATDFLIEINPRHALFYRRFLGFQQFGPQRNCSRVNAPAVLLRLTMEYADEHIRRHGGRMKSATTVKSLYPYCFSKEDEVGITGRLRRGH